MYLDLADDSGFAQACLQGRNLGFDGKTLIHPKTIATANETFGPSAEVVDWSHRVIAAYDATTADGQGVVLLEGKLIENLHVIDARRIVALAKRIDALQAAQDN